MANAIDIDSSFLFIFHKVHWTVLIMGIIYEIFLAFGIERILQSMYICPNYDQKPVSYFSRHSAVSYLVRLLARIAISRSNSCYTIALYLCTICDLLSIIFCLCLCKKSRNRSYRILYPEVLLIQDPGVPDNGVPRLSNRLPRHRVAGGRCSIALHRAAGAVSDRTEAIVNAYSCGVKRAPYGGRSRNLRP